MDTADWLQKLGLEQYAPAFHANEIDARILPSLTVEDLMDLGVTLVGHRRHALMMRTAVVSYSFAGIATGDRYWERVADGRRLPHDGTLKETRDDGRGNERQEQGLCEL